MRAARAMTNGVRLAATLLAGTCLPAIAAEDPFLVWQGRYTYAWDGGRTAGGSAIVVEHSLTVAPSAKGGRCLIESTGFQTDERLGCRLAGDADAVHVTFASYGDGRLVNRFGVARYTPGEVLFVLTRKGAAITTTWRGFTGGEGQANATGAFFRKR